MLNESQVRKRILGKNAIVTLILSSNDDDDIVIYVSLCQPLFLLLKMSTKAAVRLRMRNYVL